MSNIVVYILASDTITKKTKNFLINNFPEIIGEIKSYSSESFSWPQIHRDIKNSRIDWLLVDINWVKGKKNFFDRKLNTNLRKLFFNFASGIGRSLFILDPAMTSKTLIDLACHPYSLIPIYIESPEEIQIAANPAHHLTIWIEEDHLHTHAWKYNSVAGIGAKKHSNDDKNQLSNFVEKIRNEPEEIKRGDKYRYYAQLMGQRFKKYLESQPNKVYGSGDLMKKILYLQTSLQQHSSISIISENDDLFPLPFEFISPNDYMFGMWAFQHSVIHQIPTWSPPKLDLSDGILQPILIDAATDEDVEGFILPDGSHKNKILERLPNVSVEIKLIERLLNDFVKIGKTRTPIILNTKDFESTSDCRMQIFSKDAIIVHFAGHSGIENDQIFLHWPLKNNYKNTISIVEFLEILSSKFPNLIYLSSCKVGQNKILYKIGEFIPFIIAHRWPLLDEEAFKFAKDFYQNLFERSSNPAKALLFTKFMNPRMRASLSSVFICGRQNELL